MPAQPCALNSMSSPVLAPSIQRPPPSLAASAILEPGRNCWRKTRVHRLAWLIDGEQYFSAFRDAVLRANHSIFILAWDIDSRTVLAPDASGDGWPATLGDFLNSVVSKRRGLRAYECDPCQRERNCQCVKADQLGSPL